MKKHEITAAYEAERKEKRAALIKGIWDNVGGEILNSSNFGKRATEQMLKIDLKISESGGKPTVIYSRDFLIEVGAMFFYLIQAHIADELEREGLA
jgi:hypothetical protein